MKKLIKKLPPKAVTAMTAAAVLLLLSGSVGGTRAALTYYSDTYSSRLSTQHIGVALLESGEMDGEEWKEVSIRNYDDDDDDVKKGELLSGMLAKGENLKIGKKYKEELKVKNTGTVGEYVRVTIYKYWVDEYGNKISAQDDEAEGDKTEDEETKQEEAIIDKKVQTLDPSVIMLNFVNQEDWMEDEAAATQERTVLYYRKPLASSKDGGENETSIFVDSVMVDKKIVTMVSEHVTEVETDNGKLITKKSTYDYDGKQFRIEVEVDAVQEHNAADAILSAWGRRVTVNNGILTLVNEGGADE